MRLRYLSAGVKEALAVLDKRGLKPVKGSVAIVVRAASVPLLQLRHRRDAACRGQRLHGIAVHPERSRKRVPAYARTAAGMPQHRHASGPVTQTRSNPPEQRLECHNIAVHPDQSRKRVPAYAPNNGWNTTTSPCIQAGQANTFQHPPGRVPEQLLECHRIAVHPDRFANVERPQYNATAVPCKR